MSDIAEALREVVDHVAVEDLARHNAGIGRYGDDPWHHLVVVEERRYLRALAMLDGRTPGKAVDLGCYVPYMTVALARRGWDVTAVDRYDMYGPSLRGAIQRCAASEGFAIVDADILGDLDLGRFDVVLLMAVVEHLNGSALPLLSRIHDMLRPGGQVLFEVPNLAELGKRIALLRGRSPLPPIDEYSRSEYPYSGHNREMTVSEVQWLLEAAGFRVDRLECFDYSPPNPGLKPWLIRTVRRRVPAASETIMVLASPI